MKILLVGIQNCASRPGYAGLFYPTGMSYISAVLKENGYQYDCIDLHTEEVLHEKPLDSWERIKAYNILGYDVVAFGGTFLKFQILKFLSKKIWELKKDVFQIAGGNITTIISGVILKETKVNCVCRYEGEETIIELLDNLKNKRQWRLTEGVESLGENGEPIRAPVRKMIDDLNKVPFPDRENWSFDIIRKAFPYGSPGRYCAIIFASRGCPFSCVFCNPPSGKKIRVRSPENIIEEIKYLKRKWNVEYIRFFDEVFIGSKEKIRQLCNLMIKEKLNICWWCQTQIKLVDEELLKLIKKAGCIEIAYGIESGSNMILSEMKKGITRELAKEVIEMTNRIGLKPNLNLIAGMPSETYETLKETRDFIMSLNYINWTQVPTIDFIVPLPNTELYNIAKEKGFIADEKKYLTKELFGLGKHTRTINLTGMLDNDFFKYIEDFNREIARDYFSKHPWKRFLSIIGLDHLRLDLMFKNFSFKQVKPIVEALLWATLGKRDNFLGRLISRVIYRKDKRPGRVKTYWKTFLGIPLYKVDWYFKYYMYKIFGITFGKLKDQKKYWDTRGKEYYGDFIEFEYHKYEIFFQDLLIRELKGLEFNSIFEAGCGFGWNVKRVKKEFSGAKVGGLDFSVAQLKNSRHYQPDIVIPVVNGDARSMPFEDNAFDVGFTMGVYMNIHPAGIDSAIDELLRVSKRYIIHLEWDQDNTTPELREKRIFKTNIISHDYKKLYEKRGKRVLKFATYKDFGDEFAKRFPSTEIGFWKPFEGAEKYVLIIVEV